MNTTFAGRITSGVVGSLLVASAAFAQGDPVYDVSGVKYGRGYFAPSSFERVDAVTGNLLIEFSDLSLPGNAGMNVSIVRSYNSREGKWRFGLAGVPLRFEFLLPNSDLSDIDFVTADGGRQNAEGAGNETFTVGFWRFNKATMKLEMPNGIVATFGHVLPNVGGFLTEVRDPFDNVITLTWQSGTSTLQSITQALGNNHYRTVSFTNWADDMPDAMTYDGRTWTYEWQPVTVGPNVFKALRTVTPPLPPLWKFTYEPDGADGLKLATILTPHGGVITYGWGAEAFPTTPTNRIVVRSRTTSWRAPDATWNFDWLNGATKLVVSGPTNRIAYETTEINGEPIASVRTLLSLTDAVLETETLTYETIPNPVTPIPAIKTRTLTRDGATYTTTYTYSASDFADYGQPITIAEVGQLSRTTALTYRHDLTKYIRGRLASSVVTVGAQSYSRSFQYNGDTGFLNSATSLGLTSTFTSDGMGNVATARNPLNQATEFGYDWGVVKSVSTPEWTVTSTLNEDGTAASVSRGGVTTTFQRNALGAVTSVATNTPGRIPVTTSFTITNDILVGVTVSRGTASVSSNLDGFGRVISVTDSTGTQTEAGYNGMGQLVSQSLPFGGSVAYAARTFTYDEFGRIKKVFTPGVSGEHIEYGYGATTVGAGERVSPSVWRTTEQTFAAFGDPSDARLVSFRDQANGLWTYAYNGLGTLTGVDSNVGPARGWIYDSRNMLTSETHPESGTTLYEFDNAGRLFYKQDARGPSFGISYEYDANNRLKKIDAPGTDDDVRFTYDTLDRTTTIENGAGAKLGRTTFTYDTASRVTSRVDLINGRTFTQAFTYDGMDRLVAHDYPSNSRRVSYEYDAPGRLTAVKTRLGAGPEQTLAPTFTYHPSGAISGYTLGNGQVRSVTFDTRQRPTHWVDGPLDITYGYDHANNVTSVSDVRPAQASTYSYDILDRLTQVLGAGATSFSYDGTGNRLTAGTVNFNYDANWRLASLSGTMSGSFTYNAIGSTLTDPTGATYAYTALNMLKSATVGSGTTNYQYGADGFRTVKTAANQTETLFVRGGGSNVVAEFQASGEDVVVGREYIYLGSTPLVSLSSDGVALPDRSIRLKTPTANQAFASGQTVTLTAEVTKPTAVGITRVEYYRAGQLIGSSTAGADYPVAWTNVPLGPGNYTIRARVVFADGKAVSSAPITIVVN